MMLCCYHYPVLLLLFLAISLEFNDAFVQHPRLYPVRPSVTQRSASDDLNDQRNNDGPTKKKIDNKAMAFLRSKGRVGGASAQDFINAMGVDEGPAGGKNAAEMHRRLKKAQGAYQECTSSGVIDDLSETFPFTSSGNSWSGVTDRVMGGRSNGSLTREMEWDGKVANVLRGKVSLENNGGFVQMATDLPLNLDISSAVDASKYGELSLVSVCFYMGFSLSHYVFHFSFEIVSIIDGVELIVRYDDETSSTEESFNVHIKNGSCTRKFSSYRASFTIKKGSWETVRLCWSDFKGRGPGVSIVNFEKDSGFYLFMVLSNLNMNCVAIG